MKLPESMERPCTDVTYLVGRESKVVSSQELRVEESVLWAFFQENYELATLFLRKRFFKTEVCDNAIWVKASVNCQIWLGFSKITMVCRVNNQSILKRIVKGIDSLVKKSWELTIPKKNSTRYHSTRIRHQLFRLECSKSFEHRALMIGKAWGLIQ